MTRPGAGLLAGALLAAGVAQAAIVQGATAQTPAPAQDAWLPRTSADLRVLDKVSTQITPLTLKVGQAAENVSLSIALRACLVRPPTLAQDAAAYLDIIDSRPGAPGFHGWIFTNEPAISMLEHPIYDLRLVGCH